MGLFPKLVRIMVIFKEYLHLNGNNLHIFTVMDRSAFKKKLKAILRERGITQKELAAEIGCPPQNLSEMVNGKRNDKRLLDFLSERYGEDFTIDDKTEQDVAPIAEQDATPYYTNSNGVRFLEREDGFLLMQVPRVKYSAFGSPGDEYNPTPYYNGDAMETDLFPVDKVYHGKYYSFEVEGDSMDDGTRRSFQRGDVVLVRELEKTDWLPALHISDWPFWVVCWGNNIRLKEILEQDGDIITLHSLNPSPEYTDFKLHMGDINRIFNVIKVKPKEWEPNK